MSKSVCESTVFSSSLLRFFFFDYAIDTAFLKSRLETAIAGDTSRRRKITLFQRLISRGSLMNGRDMEM